MFQTKEKTRGKRDVMLVEQKIKSDQRTTHPSKQFYKSLFNLHAALFEQSTGQKNTVVAILSSIRT